MKKFLFLFLFFTASLLSGDGFAPETLIKTVDGYTPIEKIEVGQVIQSFNCKNNEITINPVIAKHHYRAKSYLVIKLENEEITCSRNQKFYLPVLGKWIKAKDLLHDKKIRDLFCQEFAVLEITKIEEPKELHTFTINPHHNFFTTKSDILAHNFAPAIAIPLITYSFGEGFILFGGLGATGVAGVIYRESIKEVVKGVVENLKGYCDGSLDQSTSPEPPDDENKNKINDTKKKIQQAAEDLGFKKTNFYSHGQAVFQKGKKFISRDVDSHNGGFWKMADSVKNLARKQTRLGTFDEFLNRIGD